MTDRGHDHPHQAGHDNRHQINAQQLGPAVNAFEIGAKDPQTEHVEDDVGQIIGIVQESIRQQLIEVPGFLEQIRVQAEPFGKFKPEQHLGHKDRDVGQNQIEDHRTRIEPMGALVVAIVAAVGKAHSLILRFGKEDVRLAALGNPT